MSSQRKVHFSNELNQPDGNQTNFENTNNGEWRTLEIAAGSSGCRIQKKNPERKPEIQALVENNLWISRACAGKYAEKYSRNQRFSLDVEDLEQEGCIGLLYAAERFNPSFGCSFASYAFIWVERNIRRAIEDKGELIRKPASQHARSRKVHKFTPDTPVSEVAKATGLAEKEVRFVRELDNTGYISLSESPAWSETETWEDILPDDSDAYAECEERMMLSRLRFLVTSIKDEPSRKIMMWYLGYTDDSIAYTCPQIAKMTGMTKYRIRKTIENVFKSIRIQLE